MRKYFQGRFINTIFNHGFWEKGAGEVTGFIAITPIAAFFLVVFINTIQMGMVRTRLEYAAYTACRAAVVSESEKEAKERAEKALQMNMADVTSAYDISTLKVDLELNAVKKTMTVVSKNGKKKTTELKQGKSKGWEKGATVTCIVRCRAKTLLDIVVGSNPMKTASVTMMIEKGNSMSAQEIADLAYSS